MAILSTPAAVDHLNARRKETGRTRTWGRKTLLKAARAGDIPAYWINGRPFFSDIALDEWQRRMERGAA